MWVCFQVWTLMFTLLNPMFTGSAVTQPHRPEITAVLAPAPSAATVAAQIKVVTIANRDMNLMRQDPSVANVRAVYARYKPLLSDALPALELDDDGLALIFATLVAYQAAPYGSEDGPVVTLKDMFAQGQMECRGYALFVAMMFRKLHLSDRWQVYLHGFDGAKFIGNHAQVIAVDTHSSRSDPKKRTGLVLDATVGVVAKVTLNELPLPVAASHVLVLGQRSDTDVSTVAALKAFRTNVIRGLTTPGAYSDKNLIYLEDTSVFLGVGTLNPNLKTAIGVVGRALYVLPAEKADTSKGVWQEFYTYNGYQLFPPFNPAVIPYRACDAPAPDRPSACSCFSDKAIIEPLENGQCPK